MVGASVQDDMYYILLRFRLPKIAFTGDLAKMYRPIKVIPEDCDTLQILYKKDFTKPVEEFRLRTVTYGTSCAPFTATRTLKQLALDEGSNYPLALVSLQRDFYFDDLMTGCEDIDVALQT